jgi:hypothetical protein
MSLELPSILNSSCTDVKFGRDRSSTLVFLIIKDPIEANFNADKSVISSPEIIR